MIPIGWHFDNSYSKLSNLFFTKIHPESVPLPHLIIANEALASTLGLNIEGLKSEEGIAIMAGNRLPEGATPLAQAYGGHQFGYFSILGDGRAILLGEHLTPDGTRVDVQLKGSGRTPYSRTGDGKATLGPMIREYLISEAMYHLNIPTTRSLGVVITGETIQRNTLQPGAILTRIASSHIRVGTFEYIARRGTFKDLKQLADYTIKRHFKTLEQEENPYLKLFEEVCKRQALLVAKWMSVGFIHGVINTDNVLISGETIDYGPCAFMDTYNLNTVFSSIDHEGRYAFGNQPTIMNWNMARFAETLLPLINQDKNKAIKLAQEVLNHFKIYYTQYWLDGMRKKLGLLTKETEDEKLIHRLLELMSLHKSDYTNTFKALTLGNLNQDTLFDTADFKDWYHLWQKRLALENQSKHAITQTMKHANPAIIPRNAYVEQVIQDVVNNGNTQSMMDLLNVTKDPYGYTTEQASYSNTPYHCGTGYRTYCGT